MAPAGPLPVGVAIGLPDLSEVTRSLARCIERSGMPPGRYWSRDEAEEMAQRVVIWLDHSGLCLSDLCDGTLTVMMIDPAEEPPLSPCDH